MMWGFGAYGFLWMVLFWVGIGLLVAWAVRSGGQSKAGNRALEILEERFARGEIDVEELKTRRQELSR